MENKNKKVKNIKLNTEKEVWFYGNTGTYLLAEAIKTEVVPDISYYYNGNWGYSAWFSLDGFLTDYGISELEKGNIIVEFDGEKPRMKYPNGAVVKLEEGESYCYIDSKGDIYATPSISQAHLQNQEAFLTREEAKKWLDVKNTHNRLLKKIIEINYENDWVADWGDKEQSKYCLYWNIVDDIKDFTSTISLAKYGDVAMCEQAKDYMMSDEVSDEDFKKFLLIMN